MTQAGADAEPTTGTDAERRWRMYPMAVIAAVIAAICIVVVTSDGVTSLSGGFGGDFPEFYAAGEIVADGHGGDLYDLDRQIQAQSPYWENDGEAILFAYPPIFAAPYVPLSMLDYRLAYLVHTLGMIAALAAAIWVGRDLVPVLREPRHRLAAFAFALTFLPMFIGVTLGQNTALTLLAFVTIWWALEHRRDTLAGLVAGLLLIKPQYGLAVLGLLVVARRWSAVAAGAVGALFVWIGSAAVSGPGWTSSWIDIVTSLSEIDGGSNLQNEISWLGLAEVALGAGSTAALILAMAASLLTVAALLVALRRRPVIDGHAVALVVPTVLLVAPHALYYDAGLLLLSLGVLLTTVSATKQPLIAACWWAAGLGHVFAGMLGVQPVALLVLVTWWWAYRTHRRLAAAGVHQGEAAPLA